MFVVVRVDSGDVSLHHTQLCKRRIAVCAGEGPLAGVLSYVCSEEGCLPEGLPTAWDVADVLPLLESRLTGPGKKIHII